MGKEIKLDAKKVPVYKKKEVGMKTKKQPLVLKYKYLEPLSADLSRQSGP